MVFKWSLAGQTATRAEFMGEQSQIYKFPILGALITYFAYLWGKDAMGKGSLKD